MNKQTKRMLLQRSSETYNEALKMLKTTGRCAIIRPTGFGKTVIMCNILRNYKKTLYVYPSEIVKEHAANLITKFNAKDGKKDLSNVQFVSYSYFGKLNNRVDKLIDKLMQDKYDLIIFDEMHHMGARLVKKTMEELLDNIPGYIHILGGTATPDRMDAFDIIGKYFNNSIVSFYGLNNMIEDGLIPKPYYVYSTIGTKWAIEKIEKTEKLKFIDTKVTVDLRKRKNQVHTLLNAPNILFDTMNKVYKNKIPSYMKFMVYFPLKEVLEQRKDEVYSWLKVAFPDYKVNEPIVVHSDADRKENVYMLDDLKKKPKTIDLILSVNMLNEGYHTGDITACILLRPTLSRIVYTQQIGRSFSVGMGHTPIIFDFVQNINIKELYGINTSVRDSAKTDELIDKIKELDTIKPGNITVDDRVAQANTILAKIDSIVKDNGIEKKVLENV